MPRGQALCGIVMALILTIGPPARAGQACGGARLALVIGNSSYPDNETALQEPIGNARAMANGLKQVGFATTELEDAGQDKMQSAIAALEDKVTADAVVTLFFSGYGIQSGGHTYLIPVDARIWNEQDVRAFGINLDRTLADLAAHGATIRIAVVDAARRNPFERRFRLSGSSGLAAVTGTPGILAFYSAAPGTTFGDAGDPTSPLVDALVKQMVRQGAMAEDAVRRARVEVSRSTRAAQAPWVSSFLGEDIPLRASDCPVAPRASPGSSPTEPIQQSPAAAPPAAPPPPAPPAVVSPPPAQAPPPPRIEAPPPPKPVAPSQPTPPPPVAEPQPVPPPVVSPPVETPPPPPPVETPPVVSPPVKTPPVETPTPAPPPPASSPPPVSSPPEPPPETRPTPSPVVPPQPTPAPPPKATSDDDQPLDNPDYVEEVRDRLFEQNYNPGEPGSSSMADAIGAYENYAGLPTTDQPTMRLLNSLRGARSLKPWGAVAFAEDPRTWGMSWGSSSRREAIAVARARCGSDRCTDEQSFFGDNCGALAVSSRNFSITWLKGIARARQTALDNCGRQGPGCRIIGAVCADGTGRGH